MVKNTHLLNEHMLLVHTGIASVRQFQCVPKTYVTEIKETYLKIYTKQVSCPLSLIFKTSQTANQSVLKYLSLYGKLFIFAAISPNLI